MDNTLEKRRKIITDILIGVLIGSAYVLVGKWQLPKDAGLYWYFIYFVIGFIMSLFA